MSANSLYRLKRFNAIPPARGEGNLLYRKMAPSKVYTIFKHNEKDIFKTKRNKLETNNRKNSSPDPEIRDVKKGH